MEARLRWVRGGEEESGSVSNFLVMFYCEKEQSQGAVLEGGIGVKEGYITFILR